MRTLISCLFISFTFSCWGETSHQQLNTDYFLSAVDFYKNEDKKHEDKKNRIKEVLDALNLSLDYEHRSYWNAVFLTFKCEIEDQGRLIPFCIIGHLSEIKNELQLAYQKYPEYYHHAPARTLGIMYFKMPALVGGSNKIALKYLKESYEGSPQFHENKKWLEEVEKK